MGAASSASTPNAPGSVVDFLGVGLGPANLGLAIAVEEMQAAGQPQQISALFVEQQKQFSWHDDMLLPESTMQISFLKDLVTQRAPTSSYSFLNYLHSNGRLTSFINLKSFFPSRHEFHGYLRWAADRLRVPVRYGTRVERIDRGNSCFEVLLRGECGTIETVRARNVVMGVGIQPCLPEGVVASKRVFHNHKLLTQLREVPGRLNRRFLVIGAGQSAAEVAGYLHGAFPDAEVHASLRRFGYSPADDTPYANRIFDPETVDVFYEAPPEYRERLLRYHHSTNYAAVDSELIEDLYRREYEETVDGRRRLFVHPSTQVADLEECSSGVTVKLSSLVDGSSRTLEVDAVVYATGFRPEGIRSLFGESLDVEHAFSGEVPFVERDYRLRATGLPGNVYLNGGVEHTHGLTSSLLSNIAIRAQEIVAAVCESKSLHV